MKKLLITLMVLAIGSTSILFAQENKSQTMAQARIEYMKKNLTLSDKEAQTFWKVYEEFLDEEFKIMDAYRNDLEKQGIKLGPSGTNKEAIANMSDKQLNYMQDKKFELRQKLLTNETNYYKKFKAILTARNIQNLYNAEYNFKKLLTTKRQELQKEATGPVNGGKKKR